MFALRMCILYDATTWDDVRETLEAVESFGREELSKTETPGVMAWPEMSGFSRNASAHALSAP